MNARQAAGRRLPVLTVALAAALGVAGALAATAGPTGALGATTGPTGALGATTDPTGALLAPGTAAAQGTQGGWMPLGPAGGEVTGLAVDPASARTLYATTMIAGLFKSTNGGATWAQASSGLDVDGLLTVAASPRGVLFAGADSGVFRSLDHAVSWQRVTLRRQYVVATQFAFDPFSPTTVYAASVVGGAYKSSDGGTTWESIGDGLGAPAGSNAFASVQTLAAGPRRGLLLAGSQFGLYRSANAGADWTPVQPACAAQALLFDPLQPLRVYAGCTSNEQNPPSHNSLLVSADGGLSWKELAGPFGASGARGVFSLAAVPRTRLLLAGTDQGIYLSRDSGAHWAPLASFAVAAVPAPAGSQAMAVGALAVAPGPAPVIYAGTGLLRDSSANSPGRGVWSSSNLGATWAAASAGLTATTVQALAVDFANGQAANVDLYAGTSLGAFRSRSAGASWLAIDSGLTDPSVTALGIWTPPSPPASAPPVSPAPLYAISSAASVAASKDAGRTWTARGTLPTLRNSIYPYPVTSAAVDPLDPDHVLVAGGADVFQSHDAGMTWDAISGLPVSGSAAYVSAIAFAPSQPSTVYAVASWFPPGGIVPADAVYRSLDGGATWTPSGMNGARLLAVTVHPLDADTVYVGGFGDIYVSADGGATWNPQGFPGTNNLGAAVTSMLLVGGPSTFDLVAAVAGQMGYDLAGPAVWLSQAPQGTWGALGPNQPPAPGGVVALAYDPLRLRLYAATPGTGVWSIELVPPP